MRVQVVGLGLVAERAPEPLHGARGRSVVSLSFSAALTHPFRSKGGVHLRSPLECEPGSLGLGKAAGRAPEPLAWSERAISGFPIFFGGPRASFSLRRRGSFAEPPRVRAWVAWSRQDCRRSPLAPARCKRTVRVPLAFRTTLALPFHSEGGVEYARLPSVGVSGDTSGELLSGKSSGGPCPIR